MDLIDCIKSVAHNIGRTAAKEGVLLDKWHKPLISKNVIFLLGDILLITGIINQKIEKDEYMKVMKSLIETYNQGYFSVSEAERLEAQANAASEDDATAQRVVDLIQKHFPGSIVVPL